MLKGTIMKKFTIEEISQAVDGVLTGNPKILITGATGLIGEDVPLWGLALIMLYTLSTMILAGAVTWWLWKKVRCSWPFTPAEPQHPLRAP